MGENLASLRAALDATGDGVFVLDREGNHVISNKPFARMWKVPDALLAGDPNRVLELMATQILDADTVVHKVREVYKRPRDESRDLVQTRDGRFIEMISRPHVESEALAGRIWTFHDITEQMMARDELVHAAFHDPLTGLPNRSLFMNSLDRLITLSRPGAPMFAVMFLDLDRFKVVNDGLGHLAGDLLLVEIASRLRAIVPPDCMVARLGGDEFTVLVETVASEREVVLIAERILSEIKAPVLIESHEVFTTVSIGVAFSNEGYVRPEEMIRDADTAMYQAKRSGKSHFKLFQSSMRENAVSLMRNESDLRRALAREELAIHYQPVVDGATRTVMGFEALVRWQHPTRGFVPPLEFITLAEETGLIVPLGEWVLRRACETAARLNHNGHPIYMSVNLSSLQLRQSALVKIVSDALADSGVSPDLLYLELTETALMDSDDRAIAILRGLRDMGISLSIDDFGTGYSSLSYLKRFPVNGLKIDRSFVKEIPQERSTCEITRVIIAMSRILGLRVVAEGVETRSQLEFLLAEGCESIQGYFFSRPVPEDTLEACIASIQVAS
ncbi:MAG: EAL domain-containing protein [Leptospirales bacterium]|nr:EAL domain-containing protein [Leptospirales bacterium]